MPKPSPKTSEKLTREQVIDQRLVDAGWRIVPARQFDASKPLSSFDRCAIEEYATDNGPADYALCAEGEIVGIVEAKKLTLGPQNVLSQAERYSKGVKSSPLNFRGFRVPFLYSTNGEVIWYHDIRHELSRSRRIAGFHTPEALSELLRRDFDAACDKVLSTPNDHPWVRDYQRDANDAIDRKREMLVAMATGTGKTFTMVNEVFRLMESGVAKRILFLVDRRALAAQAVREFASFEARPGLKFNKIYEVYHQQFKRDDIEGEEKFDSSVLPAGYLQNPKAGHAFVYVSTIQRMMINLLGRDAIFDVGDEDIDEDAAQEKIPIHAFDLIIADECHRGYTAGEISIWRQTLDHFDAIKIGLTATPASHTTTYFKEVAFRYGYERAVSEGYLVDYDAVALKSNVRMHGIFLKEGEEVGVVNPETGTTKLDFVEDERQFDTTDIEAKITSPDSNRKILEEIKRYAVEHEAQYGRFPKTLIFAANDLPHTSHADQLVNTARDVFGRGDSFVAKITGSPTVDRPLQRIREFRNRPQPGIVVTVDMLSTGVDIPDLEYIVFLRPVKSRILFEQMVGRGTRKGLIYKDKSHFVVFDCFDGTLLEYFRKATAITEDPPRRQARTVAEIIEDIWNNRDRDYNIKCLGKRLRRIDKEMAPEARELFAAFIDDGDIGRFAAELPKNLRQDFTGTMKTLRTPAFQALLTDYPRALRTFLVAHETEDLVTSEWRVRGADGKEYKPADYLAAFSEFVEKNEGHIEALRVLLDRPQDWNTEALSDLKAKLLASPQRFTPGHLQKAHEIQYRKALVDIISMVKHARDAQSPLLTASERVERAIATITNGRSFTPEQEQWLGRIREHLRSNLTIDRDDFEVLPVFTRYGGWGRASRAFGPELTILIKDLNQAIAA
jgi:type I restriction enzyme, R subunit